jgi:hypothetical protein
VSVRQLSRWCQHWAAPSLTRVPLACWVSLNANNNCVSLIRSIFFFVFSMSARNVTVVGTCLVLLLWPSCPARGGDGLWAVARSMEHAQPRQRSMLASCVSLQFVTDRFRRTENGDQRRVNGSRKISLEIYSHGPKFTAKHASNQM